MATIRKRWAGAGLKESFYEWKDWVINKTKRRRRDLRKMWRIKYRHFTAAMESVNIAEAQVMLWTRQNDAFTDAPFWRHSNTNEMSWTKPHIMMYLPGHFEVPSPPDALPPGVSIDDTTDEEKNKKDSNEDGKESKKDKKGKEGGATLLEDALGENEEEEEESSEEDSSEEESGTEDDDEFDEGGSELGTDAGTEVSTNDGTEGGMESVGSGSAGGSGKGSVGSVGGASQKSIKSGRSSKSGGGSRNSRVSGSNVPDSPSVRTQLGGDWDAGEEKETFDASHDEEARVRTGASSTKARQGSGSGLMTTAVAASAMVVTATAEEEEEVHANIADAGLAHDGIDSVKKWRLLPSAQVPQLPGIDLAWTHNYQCPLSVFTVALLRVPSLLSFCTNTNTILPLALPPPPARPL
jgi:hypothetical protein